MNESSITKSVSQELQQFLLNERDAILLEWEETCRKKLQSTQDISQRDQLNNIPSILEAIAKQTEKKNRNQSLQNASRTHAEQRWKLGFSLEDVTREYGLLRRVILRKLLYRIGEFSDNDLVLLDEGLDEAILEGVMTYVANSSKTLEDERERLQVTLRSIGDGVIGTDARGRITYLNPAAEDIIGWPREDAIARPFLMGISALF
jgi:PAS domain-containing protein